MSVTILGLVLLAVFFGFMCFAPGKFIFCVALSACFPDSAVVVVRDIAVSPYFVSIVLYAVCEFVIARKLRAVDRPIPHRSINTVKKLLVALGLYSLFITLVGPGFFARLGVIAAGLGLDDQIGRLSQLSYSTSNLAQVIYLGLNICLVLTMASAPRISLKLVMLGLGIGVLVALLVGVFEDSAYKAIHSAFDNSPRNFYATENIYDLRWRGQFSEASHLGAFSTTIVFLAASALVTERRMPWTGYYALLMVAGIVLLVQSVSGTAVVAVMVMLAISVALGVFHIVQKGFMRIGWFFLSTVALITGAVVSVPVFQRVSAIISAKTSSSSYSNRGAADLHGLNLLMDSWFLGVGLGSNRTSSLVALLLSNIGIVGTALFLGSMVWLLSLAGRSNGLPGVPAAWGMGAMLVCCVISVADPTAPLLWLLAGTAASAASTLQKPPLQPVTSAGHSTKLGK